MEKFLTLLEELQWKVTTKQENYVVEVFSKLKQCAYLSKEKGNEAEFVFNNAMEELIQLAKHELM